MDIIKQCVDWLDKDLNVGAFNLIPIEAAKIESREYPGFCYMPIEMEYRFNAQACIWRKDILNRSVMDIESPWDWEILGNERNRILLKDVDMYSLKFGIPCPYDYNFINYDKSTSNHIEVCSAIMRGCWAVNVISDCFKKNNIEIDYNVRGIYKEKKQNIFVKFIKILSLPIRILFNYNHIRDKKRQYKNDSKEKRRLLVDIPISKINE